MSESPAAGGRRLVAVNPLPWIAGGETTLLRLLPRLSEHGWLVSMTVPAAGRFSDAGEALGLPVRRLALGPPERRTATSSPARRWRRSCSRGPTSRCSTGFRPSA